MSQLNGHLGFVNFGAEADSLVVQKRLTHLGYQLDVRHGTDWLERGGGGATVLLLGEGRYPRRQLLAALGNEGRGSVLGVFSCREEGCDSEISRGCNEFVFWPCHDRELRLRVERLIAVGPTETIFRDDQGILSEFAELNMVGRSPAFIEVLRLLRKIARCDAPVLISGETGTGKEVAARAIHYLGTRRALPFIPVNCGAIPDTLIENEFFGHKKGAFTDARESHSGLVEQANGGTLFLDEVGTLSPRGQVALLRFLQSQEYRSLGGRSLKKADVRIIAASNANLDALVRRGQIRQDLLFRLNIMSVRIPPLRERPGDAELLIRHFLRKYQARYEERNRTFHPEALKWVRAYDWPGNVREVENLVHREFLLAEGRWIFPEKALPPARSAPGSYRKTLPFEAMHAKFNEAKAHAIEQFERQYLSRLLEEAEGNVSLAAKRSGKERRALGKLLKKHGIDRVRFLPRA